MWIKICANTNLEDALLAAELGVDAVGFVFATSKRQVTPAQVAAITPHLPLEIERVGVFDTSDVEEIALAVEVAGLTAVQLHGGVNLDLAGRLGARLGDGIEIIQTAHWSTGHDSSVEVLQDMADVAAVSPGHRLLVDSKVGGTSGGTGVAFDWHLARRVLQSQPELRVIVAGGLNPENVGEAIRELSPWGVDVASGVESKPGKKDPERLKRFIAAARGAASETP